MRSRSLLTLLCLVLLAACGVSTIPQSGGGGGEVPKKVFVCKYVSKPGEAERLQTGQNPISVSVNSIPLGDVHVGSEFADAQGRSVVIAFDEGQPEPDVSQCPPPKPPPTTTTQKSTTTTEKPHETTTTKPDHGTTTTTKPPHETTTTVRATTTTAAATTTTMRATTTTAGGGGTTTTAGGTTTTTTGGTTTTTGGGGTTSTTRPPTPGLFSVPVAAICADFGPAISITFGNRPDLNGQTGTLLFDGGSPTPLVFQSNSTVVIPWPAGLGNINVVTYTVGTETATAGPLLIDEGCVAVSTTTTTSTPSTTTTTTVPTSTTGPTTTIPGSTTTSTGVTTTTSPGTTTTTLPETFAFGAAATVCSNEVPVIVINFQNRFPQLAGVTGTLTFADINGNVVGSQPLVYQPNTTVTVLYPGTSVNPDGSIADVPGWILQPNGLWVRDPSDEFLREGINLTYTVNPTATAFVTYPPESAACANPENPPGAPTTVPGAPRPPGSPLPPTGSDPWTPAVALGLVGLGSLMVLITRRRATAKD
jgi:hypothetical protein